MTSPASISITEAQRTHQYRPELSRVAEIFNNDPGSILSSKHGGVSEYNDRLDTISSNMPSARLGKTQTDGFGLRLNSQATTETRAHQHQQQPPRSTFPKQRTGQGGSFLSSINATPHHQTPGGVNGGHQDDATTSGCGNDIYVKVNPRLHAPAKFMINPRNSLSVQQQQRTAISTRHSSINVTNKDATTSSQQGISTNSAVPQLRVRSKE